jgi:hypothetical protein
MKDPFLKIISFIVSFPYIFGIVLLRKIEQISIRTWMFFIQLEFACLLLQFCVYKYASGMYWGCWDK